MNWMEIQSKLNDLNDKYLELNNDKMFLENETNFETNKKAIDNILFYLVKAIKNKIKDLPVSDEETRKRIMDFGNDIDGISKYINKLVNDFELYEKGMKVVKTIIDLSDKEYEFEDGFENSLSYKQKIDYIEKTIEMMNNDKLTIEEKYDYIDSFDKTLSNEDQGELHVQALIGKDENHIVEMKTIQILSNSYGNAFEAFKKFDEYYQFVLEVGAVAENRMDNEPLEKRLEDIGTILDSPYVKKMNQNSKNR